VNLKHYRYFMAVAEERHFSRAADRLGIAQPALSQSVARLEASLGFPLFERTRRSVELTLAGKVLMRELPSAFRQFDYALGAARKTHDGALQTISIGFVAASLAATIPAALRQLRSLAPNCAVNLRKMSTEPQRLALLDGGIDIGFMFPDASEDAGICSCIVEQSRIVLAIPANWPLARRAHVSLAEVRDLPLIMFPPDQRPDVHAALMAECRRHGFNAKIVQESSDPYTTFSLVAAEFGVGITYETSAESRFAGVTFVPLTGTADHLKLGLSMAWRAEPGSPALSSLISALADKLKLGALNPAV
jgi:DNA-binding transcriptional LysR family regulator